MMIRQHNVLACTIEELRAKWHVPKPRERSTPKGLRRGYEVFSLDAPRRAGLSDWKTRIIFGVRFTPDEARQLAEKAERERPTHAHIKIATCLLVKSGNQWFRVYARPVPNVLETPLEVEPVKSIIRHPACSGTCHYALDVNMPEHTCQEACQYLQQGVPHDNTAQS